MTKEEKRELAKKALLACKGYEPKFIDGKTNLDFEKIVPTSQRSSYPKVEGNKKGILNYTNLSVLYNSERRVPFVAAYNVDGSKKVKVDRKKFRFDTDPRMEDAIQLSYPFYDLRKDIQEFEIGHMASHAELSWGKDAMLKSGQTFYFPNSVPQAEKLNGGIWQSLEAYIIEEAATLKTNKKICVFTGPLLNSKDPRYNKDPDFRIPLLFYKVIVFINKKGIFSTGFMMSHEQKMIEQKMFLKGDDVDGLKMMIEEPASDFTDFKYAKVFQVNIKFLEKHTGLKFTWKGIKSISVPDDKNQIKKIRKIKNAADAKDAEKLLRNGFVPENLTVQETVTPNELKNKTYKLNIILP